MIHWHVDASKRSLLIRAGARAVVRPTLGFFPSARPVGPVLDLIDLSFRAMPRSGVVEAEQIDGGDWRAELVSRRDRDPAAHPGGAVVYFHGGAFVTGGLASHRRIVEALARRSGQPVLSVAYRQGRRGLVADSIVDCVAAVNLLIDRGYDPSRLVLAGDSAGGHLAFAVTLAAARQGIDLGGVVAISPWLDFDNSVRRHHRNAWRDPFIPTFRLARMARQVTGSRTPDPALSPVNAMLADLPPALLVCGSEEILRFDAELMTRRLEAVGVQADLHVWAGQVHAFPVMAGLTPESGQAVDVIVEFVRSRAGRRVADDPGVIGLAG